MLVRLQRILSRAGIAARRPAEDLICAGRVTVNGRVVDTLGSLADPERDEIAVDGRPVGRPEPAKVLALHKPAGYITSRHDERGRQTVMALLPSIAGLHPVGRLDYDTEGLLLATNDGTITMAVTHPSSSIGKTYLATVAGRPRQAELERLRLGLMLEDGPTAPAEVMIERASKVETVVEITIHEGRNRQVRRMFAAVGHPVRRLVRVAIGPIQLDGLSPGAWRWLEPAEVEWLRRICSTKEPLP